MKVVGKIMVNKRTGEWVELEEIVGDVLNPTEFTGYGLRTTYTAKSELPESFKDCSRDDIEIRDMLPKTATQTINDLLRG